jgi:predicted membrane-bound mannosyltransferase
MTDVAVALALIVVFAAAARFWELGQIVLERRES